ncbi:MAG: secretin N-terminal domain-containing protein [Phycisphaeraceae bacterium]
MTRVWITMIVSLFLTATAGIAGAADAPAPASPTPPAPAPAETAEPVEAVEDAPDAAPEGEPAEAVDAEGEAVRNIRFQFDGVPYGHVVERFSAMSERPLVMETEIDGTLTFSDPDPYSYEEALDAINMILATRDAALIEEGRFLKLVALDNLERTNTRIFRGLADTGDARPGEVVTVVLGLEHLTAADILEAAQSMLSASGSIAPMTRESGLIITDRLSSIRRIERLLEEVDTESAVQRQMKVYNLVTAPGAVLSDLINQTFGEATAPRRLQYNRQAKTYQELSPNPEDYITAIFDEPSRTLILFGPRDRIQLAEELINQFEDESGGQAGEIKIFYPSTQTPVELARIVREAVPGVAAPGQGASSTQARLIIDETSQRLIVTAPAASQLDEIERLIFRVDAGVRSQDSDEQTHTPPDRLTVTRVYDLDDADVDTVEQAVRQATTTIGPGQQRRERLQITLDRERNKLIVTGSPGDVRIAEEMTTQLKAGEPLVPRQTQLITVGNDEEAERLLPLVRDLHEEQLRDQPARRGPSASIMSDPGNGRLIVSGTVADIERIEQIVEKLRSADPPPSRNVEVIALSEVRINDVIEDVRSLVDEAMNSSAFRDDSPPLLLPDATNNRLIVTASEAQYEQVKQIVTTVDVKPPQVQREIFVVELEHKSAGELIPTVNDLFAEVAADRPEGHPQPRLMPHAQERRIIVLATREDYEQIEPLIQQFDQDEPVVPRQTRTVDLPEGEAEDFALLVQELYEEQGRGQDEPVGGAASINTDRTNSRLILTGPESELVKVEAIVTQLTDDGGEAPAREETRVYRLQDAQAAEIQGLLDKSLNGDGGRPVVRILVDERSNSLIVSGSAENLEAASQLIDQLDQRQETRPRRLRLIELTEGDAEQLEPLVSALFEQMMVEEHGPNYEPATRIFSDGGSNRIVAIGPDDEVDAVAELVAELDRADPRATEPNEAFTLEHAEATEVAEIVTEALTTRDRYGRPSMEASVTADADTNSVFIGGSAEDMRAARSIIERLDVPTTRTERKLQFVKVARGQANELAALATDLWREQTEGHDGADRVSITADTENDRLVVVAPEQHLERVETLIASLSVEEEDTPERRTEYFTFGSLRELNRVLPLVRDLYQEQMRDAEDGEEADANFLTDTERAQLIVTALPSHITRIEELINELSDESEEASAPRETRMIEMGGAAEVQRLLPLVQDLYEEQLRDDRASGPADAQILADAEAGRLIVTARPNHADRIQAIVTSLRERPVEAEDRETRVYELTASTAENLASTVTRIYEERAADRSNARADRLLVLPDSATNRLIVTGVPGELDEMEAIIEQIDQVSTQTGDTRLFRLKTSEAEQVASLLSQAMLVPDRRGRLQARVSVGADPSSNTVIVSGERDDLQAAAMIIEQLDGIVEHADRDLRIFELQSEGKADELAEQTQELYLDQLKTRAEPGVGDARFIADPDTNRLIVTAAVTHLEIIQQIIEKLDASGEKSGRQMRVLSVNGSAGALVGVISQMMADRVEAPTVAERLIVSAGPDDRSLVIHAPRNTIERVEELVQSLDDPERSHGLAIRSYLVPEGEVDELAPTLARLFSEGGAAARGPQPRFEAGAGNHLLVAATEGQFERIETLIDDLQTTTEITSQLETFTLTHAQPEQVTEILERMLGPGQATRGMPGWLQMQLAQQQMQSGEVAVRVTAAPSINAVLVQGSAQDLALAEQLIANLDADPGEEGHRGRREIRSYHLPEGDVTELAPTLGRLFAEEDDDERQAPQPRFEADAASKKIMVAATRDQFDRIEAILEDFQTPSEVTNRIQTFSLEHADPEQIRQVLQEMISDEGETAGMSSWMRRQMMQQRQESDETPVRITAAPGIKAVIVQASPEQLSLAEHLIENLDVPSDEHRRLAIRAYTISEGDVEELAPTLGRLFSEEDGATVAGPQPRFEADPAGRKIMVAATEDQFERIEALLETLQTPTEITTQLRTFELEHADPHQIRQVLQEMISDEAEMTGMSSWMRRQMMQQRQESDETPVRITAAPGIKAVIVQASPEQLSLAEHLIENLDVPSDEHRRLAIRAYTISEGDVEELAPTLGRLFSEEDGATVAGPQPRFEADPAGRKIMVAATEDQFERIEALLETLQTPSEISTQVRTFTLEHAEAANVREVLAEMLSDEADTSSMSGWMRQRMMQQQQESGETPVRVTAVASIRAVIVQAPPHKLALAEQLIENIDVPDGESGSTIRTVRLEKAEAETLALAVNEAIAARESEFEGRRVSVTPEPNSNSLLINGPDVAVDEVLEIIRELDEQGDHRGIDVRIFRIQNGEAEQISATLEQMLEGVFGRRGEADAFTITVDDRTNSLVISAQRAQFVMVEQLLAALDDAPEPMDRAIRYVRIKHADAFDVASRLRMLFDDREAETRPVIEADMFTDSITIIAPEADLDPIEEMIAELDEVTRDETIQVRVIPLLEVPAAQMAEMLRDVHGQMTGTHVELVDRLPQGIRPNLPGGAVDPEALLEGLDLPEGFDVEEEPVVAIAHDRDSNTLLLSGPGYELDALEDLVTDLSFSFISSDADFRRFQLENADPAAVAETLTQLFREDPVEVVLQEGEGREGGGGGREERRVTHQQKITVIPEPRTRSVIVRARPTHFEIVETLIEQLDEDGVPPQAEMRMFALEHASPDRLLPIVEEMISHLAELRPGDTVSVHVDTASRSLIVIGREHVFEQVADVVEQFDTEATLTEADVQLVPLRKADASAMAEVLTGMLSPSADGELTAEAMALQEQIRRLNIRDGEGEVVTLDLAQPIKVAAAEASNMLILTSTPTNLPALEAVAQMMDTVPLLDGVDVRLIALERADAATIQETLEDIFTQGQALGEGPGNVPGLPEGVSGEALTGQLNVAVDARTNALILSGHPSALELAETLVADLDQDVERFVTEVELFRLRHASAPNMAPVLQAVFTETGSDPGAEGLATQVTRLRRVLDNGEEVVTEQPKTRAALMVQADEVTNTLIVAARSDMMPLITDVIQTMDIPDATGMDNIRIIPLNHANAETVQSVIEDMYEGPLASQMPPGDRPHMTLDPRTNALIVAANDKAWGIVAGLVQQLDRELPVELRDVRMILVENADAQALGGMIQQLLDARVEQRQAMGRAEAESLRVEIISDPRTNTLLVAGSREAYEMVEGLAEQLDRDGPNLAGQIDLIPLEHASAGTLAGTLSNLFDARYAAAQTQDVASRQPIILPDLRTNSLMVVAIADDRRALDDLLEQLDRKPESPAVQIELVALANNQAQAVAQMLNQVFASRQQTATTPGQPALPEENVAVHPDVLTNSVIITASGENIDVARELIEQVDTNPVVKDGSIRTFALEHAEAHRAAVTLESLIAQGVYRPGAAVGGPQQQIRERVAVEVNPRANTLIVSASPENMAIIEQVVAQIDTEAHAGGTDMRVYVLEHASAPRLVATLTDFFDSRRSTEEIAGEPTLPVSIMADDRTNALLVTGGTESFLTLERLIDQLDQPDSIERANYRIFPLANSTAAKVQQTLEQLFSARPSAAGAPAPQTITVIADPWANAVLVSAAAEDMAMVASLVERLDTGAHDEDNVEIFRLAKADASQVAETIESLYRQAGPGGQQVALNVDERLNAIVVSAGSADAKRIGSLVKRLDTEDLARVAEIRVIQLKHARANELSTLLTELLTSTPTAPGDAPDAGQRLLQFVARTADDQQEEIASALQEGVLVTPDTRTNSLVISAPVEAMPLLEHVISRLDASSPQIASIQVFSLENADAGQMADVLSDLFRLQQTAAETERSIRYTLVRPGDAEGEAAGGQPVEAGDGSDLNGSDLNAAATLGTAEQHALTVTVDMRTNSLLVGGTEHYVRLASELIAELDSSPAQERISRVYRLRHAQAIDIELAIRDFLDQERMRVTQILGDEGIGTVQGLLDREIAIVAEQSSNTLLISASPRYFPDVAELIEDLDKPQPQVLIQVMLAEVTLNDELDLGVEWSYTPVLDGTPIQTGTDFGVAGDLLQSGGFSTMITGGDFQFLLRALQAEGRLEVLSRPQILAADNMEATIQVGSEIPVIDEARTSDLTSATTVTAVDYRDVGILLSVTPRISPEGFVNLTVAPEISALSAQTVQVTPDFRLPIIDRRRAETQVSVQDGNTIIIGGLISSRDDFIEDKVPFFGDLPLIGAAFRSTRTSTERTELLIILTPHVIHDVSDANRVTREHIDGSAIHDMPINDPMRERLMKEVGEDGVYNVDPEPEERPEFRPLSDDPRIPHETIGDDEQGEPDEQ